MTGSRNPRTKSLAANALLVVASIGLCVSPPRLYAAAPLPGDLNADGVVNGLDIDGFASALTAGSSVPCQGVVADVDFNGTLDMADVTVFVQLLLGQLDPTALDPRQRQLRIGPIAALTTEWHPAPASTPVPLGTTLQFEVTGVPPSVSVDWIGAVEVQRGDSWSRAQYVATELGPHTVQVVVDSGSPCTWGLSSQLDVVNAANITCTVQVTVPPVLLDENSSNIETMGYFFSSDSIAQLKTVGPDHYSTSVARRITFTAQTVPAGFEPLMEWRRDGVVLGLGATLVDHVIGSPGNYTFEVGPIAQPEQIQIDIYAVTITSHTSNIDQVPVGEPVTFTAATTPPGFEADITWLSSTKVGTAAPVLGSGPTFTVQFDDTWGPLLGDPAALFQWLGVKAGGAVFFQDLTMKYQPPDCCKDGTKAPGAEPCSKCICRSSDPVLLYSGEFIETVTDLRIKGRGLDFEWTRTYRSRFGEDTVQGNSWDFGYNIRLEPSNSNFVLLQGTARRDLYVLQPDGTCVARQFFRRLSQNPDGSHTLAFPDTGTWEFNPLDGSPAAGKISAIIDRNDNTISFDYDASGRLAAVHDVLDNPPGNPRVINIAYNADGFISTITDFIGRQLRYEYYQNGDAGGSFGDLKSCTTQVVTGTPNGNDFPLGKTTAYTYSKGFPDERLNHNLITTTDPKGQTYLVNEYDPTLVPSDINFDRVRHQTWGNSGDLIDFVYEPVTPDLSNNFAVIRTIVNDRVGNVKEYLIDSLNRTVIFREYTGRAGPDQPTSFNPPVNLPTSPLRPGDPAFFETRWEFNADSLATRIIHPNLNEEVSVYDTANPNRRSQGNMIERRRLPGPLGGDQTQIVELYEYDDFGGGCCGTNFVTRHVDGRGHETLSTYDPDGNRLSTTHRIPSIVENFEYNVFGQMTAHVLPDNGSAHRRRDEHTYYTAAEGFQFGYRKQQITDALGFDLTTTFEYDPVGNMTRSIDPEGHDMQYLYNQLDQVVRSISAEVAPGGGVRYERDTFYDANDNVVRRDIQNKDDAGVLQPNTHFTNVYEYEILNYRTRMCQEVGDFTGAIPGPPELPTCTGLPPADFLTTEYQYDENRNRTLVRYGEAVNGNQPANVVQTLYDERDLVFRQIRAPGSPGPGGQSTDQYDYDGNKNVTTTSQGIEAAPRITNNTFDGYDRLVGSVDPMGNTSEVHYDANHNRVTSLTEGELLDTAPGGAGNVRLSETAFVFDDMDRLIRREAQFFDTDTQNPIDAGLRPADGLAITDTVWTDNSQVAQVLDDNLHTTTTVYDTANRVDIVTDAENNTVTYTYDLDSLVVAITETEKSQLGNPDELFTTTNAYDGLHRLTQTVDNVGNTHTFAYDSRNNQTFMNDALNHETRTVYDGIDRLIRTVRDLNNDGADLAAIPGDGNPDIVTTQAWDDSSRLVGQTDDSDNTTTYVYDALNRMIGEEMADCTVHSFSFDVHDNRLTMADANGSVATCIYDLLDRLTGKTIAVGPGVSNDTTAETYAYDGLSRLVLAEDNDSRVTRSHDSLSRVTTEKQNPAAPFNPSDDRTVTCLYDGVGNELESTYPGGRLITCAYDDLDRKQAITDATGPPATIATYAYVGPGRVSRREYGNGTRTDTTYDGITGIGNPAGDFGVKRIIGTTHLVIAGGATIDARTYKWDRLYNKTQRKDIRAGDPGLTHDYAYDDIYRLTRTIVTNPAATVLRDTAYNLDGVGNRDLVTGAPDPGDHVGPYTLVGDLCAAPADQDMNQYTTTPFEDRQYDANGNLIRIDDALPTQRNITYDYRNQMVEYTIIATGERHTYAYDALGRRIAKVVDADGTAGGPTETRYFYDAWQVCEEQDAAAATQATYVYGLYIDEVLNMQRGGSDFFYHTDDLYNVMAVTNSAGAVVERYEYADYGQPIDPNTLAPIPGDPSAIGNPYLFTGRRYDPETGWYYYRTRYLDPIAGRFTARDTIGIWADGAGLGNGYAYVGDRPQNWVDPIGLGVRTIGEECNKTGEFFWQSKSVGCIRTKICLCRYLCKDYDYDCWRCAPGWFNYLCCGWRRDPDDDWHYWGGDVRATSRRECKEACAAPPPEGWTPQDTPDTIPGKLIIGIQQQ